VLVIIQQEGNLTAATIYLVLDRSIWAALVYVCGVG
jgi:hypothetical protein